MLTAVEAELLVVVKHPAIGSEEGEGKYMYIHTGSGDKACSGALLPRRKQHQH